MISELAVVSLREPFGERDVGSVATVLISFNDGEPYEVEWTDMSGQTSTIPATKLRAVSREELDCDIYIDDAETLAVIRRLMTRLGMGPTEVVRHALQSQLEGDGTLAAGGPAT